MCNKCLVCPKRAWLKEEVWEKENGVLRRIYVCMGGHKILVRYRKRWSE